MSGPRPTYAVAALAIFAIEVCIALFLHDAFIRPYVGDVLAVALVYAGVRAVTPLRLWPAVAVSFAIACAVEFGQLVHLVDLIGARDNRIVRTVLGTGFEPMDFVAYAAGAALVVAIELMRKPRA